MSFPVRSALFFVLVIAAGFFATQSGTAFAQQANCSRITRELAELTSGSSPQRAQSLIRQAQRSAAQAQRVADQMRAIGCDQSRFLIFGNDPPAQCVNLRARIDNLNARTTSLNRQAQQAASGGGSEARIAQLKAAYVARACDGKSETQQAATQPQTDAAAVTADGTYRNASRSFAGAICVRTCDGFFFPLSGVASRDTLEDMCQAQCPASEAKVYFRRGDNLGAAVSLEGRSYSTLPTAFSFQKAFSPECSCKQQGESWQAALQGAEKLVSSRGRPDIVISADTSAADWKKLIDQLSGKGSKTKLTFAPDSDIAAETQAPTEADVPPNAPATTASTPEEPVQQAPDPKRSDEMVVDERGEVIAPPSSEALPPSTLSQPDEAEGGIAPAEPAPQASADGQIFDDLDALMAPDTGAVETAPEAGQSRDSVINLLDEPSGDTQSIDIPN